MKKTILAVLMMSLTVMLPAQVNGKFATVNATQGYQVNGAAPNNQALCGNGTRFVPSSSCGTFPTLYYQTTQLSSSSLPQRGRLNFDSTWFVVTDNSGNNSSDVGLHNPLTVDVIGNANTATALANTPSQCSAGNYSTGITSAGNANCTALPSTGGGFSDVTSSRSLGGIYQNAGATLMRVDANFVTSGSQSFNLQCNIGSTSGLGNNVFNQQTGSSTNGYGAHADCLVPAGWFYSVALSSSTGGTFTKTSWYETSF